MDGERGKRRGQGPRLVLVRRNEPTENVREQMAGAVWIARKHAQPRVLSQDELAQRLTQIVGRPYSKWMVSKWETGDNPVPYDVLRACAEIIARMPFEQLMQLGEDHVINGLEGRLAGLERARQRQARRRRKVMEA